MTLNDLRNMIESWFINVRPNFGFTDQEKVRIFYARLQCEITLQILQLNSMQVAERKRRFESVRSTLDKLIMQINVIKPKYTVPFAGYVWFFHEENFWINKAHNRIVDVTDRIANDTDSQPVVLYPGDEWVVGDPHSPDAAGAQCQSEFDSLSERELVKADEVSIEDLLQSGVNFCNRLAETSGGKLRLRLSEAKWAFNRRMLDASGLVDKMIAVFGLPLLSPRTAHVYLHDHKQSYALDFAKGLRKSDDCGINATSKWARSRSSTP